MHIAHLQHQLAFQPPRRMTLRAILMRLACYGVRRLDAALDGTQMLAKVFRLVGKLGFARILFVTFVSFCSERIGGPQI